jgi:DNA polymerase-3 subunit gamma/tau
MPYVSLTLKYRPQTFQELVGQPHVAQTLMNAVASDRLSHAYLFCGPRGTGKTTTARILAKAINCEKGPTPTPCGECTICTSIREGNALDIVEIDAASNRGIDEIRELRERVKYAPARCRAKVYFLDEVHMLTKEAFNALLKTLEEPPPRTFFVLVTTEPHKLPPTIISRCQRFDFRPISSRDIADALERVAKAEGVEIDGAALHAIARAGRGALRDAESIFDQVIAYTSGAITLQQVNEVLGAMETELLFQLGDVLVRGDIAGSFAAVDRLLTQGKDIGQLLGDLTTHFRNVLLAALGGAAKGQVGTVGELIDVAESDWQRLAEQASKAGPDWAMKAIELLAGAQADIKQGAQPRIALELALARISQATRERVAEAHAPSVGPPASAEQEAGVRHERPAAGPAEPPRPAQPTPVAAAAMHGDRQLDLAAVVANWEAAQAGLSAAIKALLRDGQPAQLADSTLTIRFRHQFHYTQVSERYAGQVEEALSKAFGRRLKVRCIVEEAEEATASAPRKAEQPSLLDPQPPAAAEAGPAEPASPPEPVHEEASAEPDGPADVQDVLQLFDGTIED